MVRATVSGFNVTPATITLVDDDLPEIQLSLSPDSAGEDASSPEVTVRATRDASAAGAAVTVTLAVDSSSTATSGTDYTALSSLPTISFGRQNRPPTRRRSTSTRPRTAFRSRAGRRS